MALQDTTSISGGYDQLILDWASGDDRIFTGNVTGLAPSDPNLVTAYFTLKQNPNSEDADAIIQKKVTQVSGTSGVITLNGGNYTQLLIHVFSGDYEGLVQVGTPYWWDFRVITAGGTTWTVATGLVVFLQQVTQSNSAGTPAAAPNFGQPVWRGFISAIPSSFANLAVLFNPGDFYMNSLPALTGGPAGWQCVVGGTPGTWVPFSTGTFTGFVPLVPWLFGSTFPVAGGPFVQGQIVWNVTGTPGAPWGWYCVVGGSPGTWKPMGLISL